MQARLSERLPTELRSATAADVTALCGPLALRNPLYKDTGKQGQNPMYNPGSRTGGPNPLYDDKGGVVINPLFEAPNMGSVMSNPMYEETLTAMPYLTCTDCIDLMPTCLNTPGSFECLCPRGYQWNAATRRCVDINECLANPNPCYPYQCNNKIGGYDCTCPATDATTGIDVLTKWPFCTPISPCATIRCGPNMYCTVNAAGAATCVCRRGYVMDVVARFCVPDMCPLVRCPAGSICQMYNGQPRCICRTGTIWSLDRTCITPPTGINCTGCDPATQGNMCVMEDPATTGMTSSCKCLPGYVPNPAAGSPACIQDWCRWLSCRPPFVCAVNARRVATCVCPTPLKPSADGRDCVCPVACTNGQCIMNAGAVDCKCNPGFVKDAATKACVPDLCPNFKCDCGEQTCIMENGRPKCVCPPGTVVDEYYGVCVPDPCYLLDCADCASVKEVATCSFQANCPIAKGFVKDINGRCVRNRCIVKAPQLAPCPANATCKMDGKNVICSCKAGFVPPNCAPDGCGAKCDYTTQDCVASSSSDATVPPSYSCVCKPGYILNATRSCVLNPCATVKCAANRECVVSFPATGAPTATCVCIDGFVVDAVTGACVRDRCPAVSCASKGETCQMRNGVAVCWPKCPTGSVLDLTGQCVVSTCRGVTCPAAAPNCYMVSEGVTGCGCPAPNYVYDSVNMYCRCAAGRVRDQITQRCVPNACVAYTCKTDAHACYMQTPAGTLNPGTVCLSCPPGYVKDINGFCVINKCPTFPKCTGGAICRMDLNTPFCWVIPY
ncbi:hypothetical protein HYH03_007187 [Edaphochlamys debaryana]|uniref:EGF-like domain-containing protein n=1 Tax=Edaphochlamys debaryana TaxID=47281 RepID=A0A835Y2E2_9CHLO|nr:hypothetical protein HYH03_007187 [Edaphochlamys debaryana]|eukprot:KAG2494671.1 hypothetical protein HYH03_007187 [Edaphochlamys debaryana]